MKILVVSNMYPNNKYPAYGIFVKRFCDQLSVCHVEHEKSVMYKANNKLHKLFNYGQFFIRTMFMCVTKSYDYIYIHYGSISSIPVIWASKLKSMNIIVNVHGSDVIPINAKQIKLEKNTKKSIAVAEKVIVPSEYFKEEVSKKYAEARNKISIYPSGGVDVTVFLPIEKSEKIKLYRKYELEEHIIHMGYCGRITQAKGIDTLIKAIELVDKKEEHIKFIIVGNGEYDEQLKQLIIDKNLAKRILRLPILNQKELIEIYQILDIFLFPTESKESLGLVAIEAMACGTPVITTDYAAPSYYVKNGCNGYKFKLGDYKELAGLIMANNDKGTIEHLSQGAFDTAKEFAVEKSIQVLNEILFE